MAAYFDPVAKLAIFQTVVAGSGVDRVLVNTNPAVGDFATLIVKWDAGFNYLSLNGAAFQKTARASGVPAVTGATFDIGSLASWLGSGFELDGDALWAATFAGIVTDDDAALFATFTAATVPDASDLLWPDKADVTAVWKAATATYRQATDAFLFTTFIDPLLGWQLNNDEAGYSEATAAANDGFDVLATASLTASTAYPQQYAGARVNAILDTAGWPAGERDIDTTSQQSLVQAAVAGDLTNVSALDAIQQAAANDNGVFYIDGRGYAVFKGRHRENDPRFATSQATFCDAANWAPGRFLYASAPPSSSKIVNEYRVTRRGGTEMTAADGASILKYRPRVQPVQTLHTTDAEALNYAQYRVTLDKDPQRRYDQLTITPGADSDMWLQVLSRQIGDRITVMQSPPGGGAPDVRDMIIEAVNASVGPTTHASWTWRLSPAPVRSGWTLGDPVYGVLGSTTVLTY
jgi:hypothetical protein